MLNVKEDEHTAFFFFSDKKMLAMMVMCFMLVLRTCTESWPRVRIGCILEEIKLERY